MDEVKARPGLKRLAEAVNDDLAAFDEGRREPELRRGRARVTFLRAPRRWWRPRAVTVFPFRLAAVCGVAAASIALLLLLAPRAPRAPITLSVDGPHGADAARISAPAAHPTTLRFSDGTSIVLAPTSQVQVRELAPRGATVLLAQGTAEVAVEPRPQARWRFLAGPFVVQVTGTRFSLRFRPERGDLSIAMHEGSVIVSGGPLAAGRPLRAGERLEVSAGAPTPPRAPGAAAPAPPHASDTLHGTGDVGLVEAPRPPPAVGLGAPARAQRRAPPTPRPVAVAVAERAPPGAAGSPSGSRAPSGAIARAPLGAPAMPGGLPPERPAAPRAAPPQATPDWRALVALGRYGEALDRLGADGARAVCAEGDAAAVLALADAARFAGRDALAERSLLAVRRRFPGSDAAARAGFLLARRRQDEGRLGDAAALFGEIARGAPAAGLAEEAAGRLIEIQLARGDRAAARREALAYLARFPAGPHAALARSLQE
jgi:hypothetical protein